MPRTVLVTECDSPLGAAIARLFLGRGWRVAQLHERAPAGPQTGPEPRVLLALSWNRRSPVSAHAVMLSALNSFDTLDEVVILEPPTPPNAALGDTPSAAIERALDDAKGPLFIARETLGHFQRAGSGVLSMVSSGVAAGPVAGAARECFRGLATAILGAGAPGLIVNGFQTTGADAEEYAAFIDRTLEEKARKISGRWFAFQPRGGFLQGVLAGQPRK